MSTILSDLCSQDGATLTYRWIPAKHACRKDTIGVINSKDERLYSKRHANHLPEVSPPAPVGTTPAVQE